MKKQNKSRQSLIITMLFIIFSCFRTLQGEESLINQSKDTLCVSINWPEFVDIRVDNSTCKTIRRYFYIHEGNEDLYGKYDILLETFTLTTHTNITTDYIIELVPADSSLEFESIVQSGLHKGRYQLISKQDPTSKLILKFITTQDEFDNPLRKEIKHKDSIISRTVSSESITNSRTIEVYVLGDELSHAFTGHSYTLLFHFHVINI